MVKFKILYSGSSGNCTLIYNKNTKILVDLGMSSKIIIEDLAKLGLRGSDIDAVLITHEHSDHIKGVKTFRKHFLCDIYFLEKCYKEILDKAKIQPLLNAKKIVDQFKVRSIDIRAFKTSHDSVDSCGFVFSCNGYKLGYVTDLGCFTENVYKNISGCDHVIIESNYDENVLLFSKYPNFLKRRISSNTGHLSNEQCADAVQMLVESGTYNYTLAHISQNNNFGDLALQTVKSRFSKEVLERLRINLSCKNFNNSKEKKEIKC